MVCRSKVKVMEVQKLQKWLFEVVCLLCEYACSQKINGEL